MDVTHDYTRRYSPLCMHVGRQYVSTQSQHYQQNEPNVHLPFQKQPYLALEEDVVWSASNHTVTLPDQEDASGWYGHIGENPKKKKSAREVD